jgi:MFS transporter, OFA family, oxalate/formate antiporter
MTPPRSAFGAPAPGGVAGVPAQPDPRLLLGLAGPPIEVPGAAHRCGQLVMGLVCMAMVANLQYGWTLFVNPLSDRFGWSHAAVQVAFSVFVITQTCCVPVAGYLVDRAGPRPVVFVGGLLCAAAWVLNALADSLGFLYVAAAIGGIGAGAVYGTCVGNALKWFPDRRGLAVGLTVAAFGAGSALTVLPITMVIGARGYESAFLYFGLGQGLVVMALALALDNPHELLPHITLPQANWPVRQSSRDYTPAQVLREPVFWVMYLCFVLVAAGGLMATAQLAPIARHFGIAGVPVDLFGLVLPALTFALALDRVLNGATRLFFGWVSDKIGREQTMLIAFVLEALAVVALSQSGAHPVAFVLLTALVFFAWGEIYSLFPSTCADTFGSKYAATNAGLLYTAKGAASLLVPLSSVLASAAGDWHAVFLIASGMSAAAALLAWFVLRPMRHRLLDAQTPPLQAGETAAANGP